MEDLVSDLKKQFSMESFENRYNTVLLASKRSRQLLDRAEKHGMSADVSKVIMQALEEIVSGKVTQKMPPATSKKKSKEKSED